MPLVAEPRPTSLPSQDVWLGGHYTLGTSRRTWPKVVEEASHPEQEKPHSNEPEVYLTSALSALGEAVYRQVASVLAYVMQSGQRFAAARRVEATDQLLPDVEYMVCPEATPKQTMRLEGHVRSIKRGREDCALSDADLATMLSEEADG